MGVTAGWRGTAIPKENKEKKTEVVLRREGPVKMVLQLNSPISTSAISTPFRRFRQNLYLLYAFEFAYIDFAYIISSSISTLF